MRRTQLYLDDGLWEALHARAHTQNTTISELVREAVRTVYLGSSEVRRKAMLGIVGIRKAGPKSPDAVTYIQGLRKGDRMERLDRLRKS
jgi:hypothetical protein